MSLTPLILNELLNDDVWSRPSRLLGQHFGLGLSADDLLEPLATIPLRRYYRPWRSAIGKSDLGSTVVADKNKYCVSLDVQQFAPNEITVKVIDDSIVVEGKHEEKRDEHGFISRQFTRRYVLPAGHDIDNVTSSLSSDGILTIFAPKFAAGENPTERIIPITQTGPVKKSETTEKQEQTAENK
ncbi:protein lethal(2)essential for life-like [Chrysoperla carnea]|uniref:protein lethal(2)essential for life-like n=1 Tax=Chrysoperla carnea TaxID=189513 RepID=UPI001D05CA2A|nr:protein lethal(2)essential for life-like [Chrysoperla carnea]